ncbi:MAG: FAD-binding oxidoreductase [Flavobacterium sp.]|nr:MAG: FAD-binding oxidoreductase [Flavobacterium sp.]
MKDYIIVGGGVAGICFAETAFLKNRSFTLITDDSQSSSWVAAGLYNPVILKRFSLPMDSKAHLDYIGPFYDEIEQRLNIKFDYKLPVYRKFTSVEEQNNWFEAADKPGLAPFLSTTIMHTKYPALHSPYGFGEVLHTGYVDTTALIEAYYKFLEGNGDLIKDKFDYSDLEIDSKSVSYRGIEARHIVFAEGFGIHANPYFNYLPLDGTKGELLVIKAPELKLDAAINASIFILPLGNDIYKVGATYEWYDKTQDPTDAGKAELLEKLEELISCDYEILDHLAGIRPTTKDRKSLIGTHAEHSRLHVLNGLGTRGVMLGPPMAQLLFNHIENGNPIERSISLDRFKR